jgi:hypothetical protein
MKKQKSSKPKHQTIPHHAYVARVEELEPATDLTPPGTHLIEYAGRLKRKLDELRKELEHARKERDEARADAHNYKEGYHIYSLQADSAERERDEAQERECAAIESWWEEHQRALREGQRVVEAREQNAKLREIAQWFADYFVDECYCSPVIQKAEQLRAELDRLKEGEAKDTAADRFKRATAVFGAPRRRILRGRGEVVMAKIKLPVPASGLAKIAEEVSSLAKADGRTAFTGLTRQSGDCLVIYSIPNDEEGAK